MAEGVYQLKLPVPFPLRFVCVYLVEGDDGWTIIDTGYDHPPTYEVWEAVEVGCNLRKDVARIVVTHSHPDHLGGARWLQEISGAPVYLPEKEIPFSKKLWGTPGGPERFAGYFVGYGMKRDAAERAAAEMRSGLPLPEEMLPLCPGEKAPVGHGLAHVIHAPGHADHQILLHDEERQILFSADHLMGDITPNIGLWPESEPRPLHRYLNSLGSLRSLGARLILPGHGLVFSDLAGRVEELLLHHEERLELVRRALSDGPKTPHAVSRSVFRGAVTVRQRCLALAETLAYLEHLELEGGAERTEDDPVAFRAA